MDALTPHMVYRYGFYQGGKYRTDPKRIIEFFGIRPSKSNKKAIEKCLPKKPSKSKPTALFPKK